MPGEVQPVGPQKWKRDGNGKRLRHQQAAAASMARDDVVCFLSWVIYCFVAKEMLWKFRVIFINSCITLSSICIISVNRINNKIHECDSLPRLTSSMSEAGLQSGLLADNFSYLHKNTVKHTSETILGASCKHHKIAHENMSTNFTYTYHLVCVYSHRKALGPCPNADLLFIHLRKISAV